MSVIVANDWAQLEDIAGTWEKARPVSPHAARELFSLVLRTGGSRPHVIVIERPDADPVLAVARVERRPFQVKAGYRTVLSVPARWLVLVAGGVVGARTPQDHDLVARRLLAGLRRGEADILQLSGVIPGSELDAAIRRQLGRLRLVVGGEPTKHYVSDLSAGYAAFTARRSKRTRLRLRRRLERLAQEAGKLKVRRIGRGDDLDEAMKLVEGVAGKSYQRGLGVGFFDDALHRELMGWAVAGGPFHAWLLLLNGQPVAFANGLIHERTFHLFDTAFDPAYDEEEPGATLLAQVVHELAEDGGVDMFDYGHGEALYKQQLGDIEQHEVNILCFAPRAVPLALRALMGGAVGSVRLAKRALGAERLAALRRRGRAANTPTDGNGLR